MNIGPTTAPVGLATPAPLTAVRPHAPAAANFGTRIEAAIDSIAAAQRQAGTSAAQWETGLRADLGAVMIDQQVASLGFQLALNVRNRAISAYRDIMNMPL